MTKKSDTFNKILQEILTDPDVEKAISKVAGRLVVNLGSALASPMPAPQAARAPPELLDAYRTLGVTLDCPDEVLEGAYKALAKKHHPDVEGGSEKRMKAINDAHDLIVQARKGK